MPEWVWSLLRIVIFGFGVYIVVWTILSAVRTFVLPRSQNVTITRIVFAVLRMIFDLRLARVTTYEGRDRVMALFSPIALLFLIASWLFLTTLGYTFMFWAATNGTLYEAFKISGSSLFTLGFAVSDSFSSLVLEFSEAAIGIFLNAVLIAYLPTMYAAFQRRESLVNQLEVRAGEPPSPVEMIVRSQRIRGLNALTELWGQWEVWFVDVQESHTSLAPLVYFRSPSPMRSWVTASGVILDCAAIMCSSVDVERNPQAELCIRAGYLALREIADFFDIEHDARPHATDAISISRREFDEVYDELAQGGVPMKPDRDQCWRDYSGWRVNYDRVLIALAALTMAPYARWVSDRSLARLGARGH